MKTFLIILFTALIAGIGVYFVMKRDKADVVVEIKSPFGQCSKFDKEKSEAFAKFLLSAQKEDSKGMHEAAKILDKGKKPKAHAPSGSAAVASVAP